MKKIGIVGENYQNDACAFSFLMTPQYKDTVQFIPIIKQPNTGIQKLGNLILAAIEKEELDAVLCIKDLDNYNKLTERESWFKDLNNIIKKGIFYLVVMEFEALLLADTEAVNKALNTKITFKGNPITQSDPKKWLIKATNEKYKENDSSAICKIISFEKVYKTHIGERSFQSFIKYFNDFLKK